MGRVSFKHRRTGPVSLGAEVSCPNILSIAYPKISGFARILRDLLPENGYLKNSGGGGAGAAPHPPPPRTSMLSRKRHVSIQRTLPRGITSIGSCTTSVSKNVEKAGLFFRVARNAFFGGGGSRGGARVFA